MKTLAKYLVIDTETTGLQVHTNGLIQLAALALDESLEIVAQFTQVVCPPQGFVVDTEALEINGFTLERIQAGCSYKDVVEKFSAFLSKHFKEMPVAIGQFYPFDYSFLNSLFFQTAPGVNFNKELFGNDFIDTKALANSLNLKAVLGRKNPPFPITSLSKTGGLKDVLGIEPNKFQAHDALGDCLATREVLIQLLQQFELTI